MSNDVMTFKVEDAELVFKNFAGKEQQFNTAGTRNFSCVLPLDMAKKMEADGWNIKYFKPHEEDDEARAFITIAVNFSIRPPMITLISARGRTPLTEDNVEILDWANIETVDLIARSYRWEALGKTGIKAYLQTMFVTLSEDELQRAEVI